MPKVSWFWKNICGIRRSEVLSDLWKILGFERTYVGLEEEVLIYRKELKQFWKNICGIRRGKRKSYGLNHPGFRRTYVGLEAQVEALVNKSNICFGRTYVGLKGNPRNRWNKRGNVLKEHIWDWKEPDFDCNGEVYDCFERIYVGLEDDICINAVKEYVVLKEHMWDY